MDFYDYKTEPVTGSDVVDKHKTGMSFYDDFISGNQKTIDYLARQKNLKGEVVMMSPEEYFQACSDYGFPGSHPSVEKLKQDRVRDVKILDHLKQVLTVYKHKFPMPMLNKADNGQEGLHRMMVIGDMFGWDHKVPVLVVDWADKQRAFDEAKRQRIEKIEHRIRRAVQDTLKYKFNNIDELKEQLQWELDKQFNYDDDVSTPVQFELTSDEQTKEFTVTIGAATYSFDYEDVQFIEASEDSDLEDIDLEVDDDFLVRYFGDDWRETYPHLKDKFNITESVEKGFSRIDYLPVSDIELFKEYADDILDGYGNMSDADIKSSIKEIHFEGKLAGYIGFSEYEENRNKCLGIGNFMIIERGKGLGSAVIQNIVEKYKNRYDLIYCFVDAKNDGAIRLYKKLGKVYDEDGPNDNGEYYVTFWDNGKWELDN